MEGTNALAKVGRDVFQEVIFRELGRPDESVVLGLASELTLAY